MPATHRIFKAVAFLLVIPGLLIFAGQSQAADTSGSAQFNFQKPADKPGQAQNVPAQTQQPGLQAQPVSDPMWGFQFHPPQGWVCRTGPKGAILGHNTVAGMILVWPHPLENISQLQNQMVQGLNEGGLFLRLMGQPAKAGQGILKADYQGLADGREVKALGYGLVFPSGGGAVVVALTEPAKFGPELKAAADVLTASIKSLAQDQGELVRHFSGTWVHFTKNTSTWVTLLRDGTFVEDYESGYSGQFSDQYGNQTGNWGAAGQNRERGRWRIRGTKRQGVITFIDPKGGSSNVAYRVHVENGQVYWNEYLFEGRLYSKRRK